MSFKRVFLIVLDSVGVGGAPDAALYGDEGANTVGHIAERTDLKLPNLAKIGFAHIAGTKLSQDDSAIGAYGTMKEASKGKDTTTGHWEITGLKLEGPFPTYPNGFPEEVIGAFTAAAGRGVLGNKPASGTAILDELGEEHLKTGRLIVYTSADSVFQIAANEAVVPPDELYDICRKARKILQGEHAVGRVIARPFIGDKAGHFIRTPGRRDFSLEPTGKTVLDVLKTAGFDTLAVGKIEDIFCMKGITGSNHAVGNPDCLKALMQYMKQDFMGLCFVNLVDFDSSFGHRRDVEGYGRCLQQFDEFLPEIQNAMKADDLLILTADHGCDPTWSGTDHTREQVPLVCWHRGMKRLIPLGERATYGDIAATVADNFGCEERFCAMSFKEEILKG